MAYCTGGAARHIICACCFVPPFLVHRKHMQYGILSPTFVTLNVLCSWCRAVRGVFITPFRGVSRLSPGDLTPDRGGSGV